MREKEMREQEKLRTKEEYQDEIKAVSEVVCNVKKADKVIDETLVMLAKAMQEKYAHIIKVSRPFRKRQSLFSRLRDWFSAKRTKELSDENEDFEEESADEGLQKDEQQCTQTLLFSAEQPKQIEVVDADGEKKLLEKQEDASFLPFSESKKNQENIQKDENKEGEEGHK